MNAKKFGSVLLLLFVFVQLQAQPKEPPFEYGVSLSGGGALGYAHIGALQALEDCGIAPQVISGTSMGALMGSLYAYGHTPEEIYKIIQLEKFDKTLNVVKLSFLTGSLGIIDNQNIRKFLEKYLSDNNFNCLQKPLYVCVSNLNTCDIEIISTGPRLHDYLLASAAIPGIFRAVEIDSTYYVDGGLLNNLPAEAIRDQCKTLISIDVLPPTPIGEMKKIKDVLDRAIQASSHYNSLPGREASDLVVDVVMPKKYTAMTFDLFESITQYGYDATMLYLQDHPELTNK